MKARKIIKKIGIALLILILLAIIIRAIGDIVLNRYLNNGGKEKIINSLPINAQLDFDKISIHPLRDFPNLSLKLQGLHITDTLTTQTKHTHINLDNLYLNASIKSLRDKNINIESIELVGLSLHILDLADGYSSLKSLIKKKSKKTNEEKNENDWSINYDHTNAKFTDLHLHKFDELKQQDAHFYFDVLKVKNNAVDSVYHLSLDIKDFIATQTVKKDSDKLPIRLNQAQAELLLDKSFSSITLQGIELNKGKIDLYKDSLGHTNFLKLIGSEKTNSKAKDKSKKGIDFNIDGADISVKDVGFSLIDQAGNRNLAASIIKLTTEIQTKPDTSSILDLQLDVDQLAFNAKHGALLSNSMIKGKIKTILGPTGIKISCPKLHINEDPFNVQAIISRDNASPTTLTIEKPDAIAEVIRPLLTDKIQKSISSYDVKGPLYAKAHMIFTKGIKKPRVNLDLEVKNKTVLVKGQLIQNANVSATFINGFYDDARQFTEHKKNSRFILHKVTGTFNDFDIDTENALITSSAKEGARLIAQANVSGKASSASKFLKHDKFAFQEGAFKLTTDINGSLRNLDDLIAGTNLNLAMNDMQVFYPAGNTTIPLRVLEMKKVGEKTIFEIEGLGIDNNSPIRIQGEVDHLASVLFPDQPGQLQTKANLRASSISWESLIALFGEDGIISSARQNPSLRAKRSMKQTITGINESFRPAVKVTIDTVHYGQDVQLLDFHTGLNFEDDKTLVLEETNFKIDKSNVTLDGKVIINQLDFTKFDFDIDLQNLDFDVLLPKFDYFGIHLIKQIHDQPDNMSMHIELAGELDDNAGLKPESLDAYITYESFAEDKFSGSVALKANPNTKKVDVIFGHSGHPRNLNYILESDEYRFDKGWFTISFEFDDNFESLAQMVEESKIGLTINEAEVFITDLGITVPLSRIEVASLDNKAYYYMLLKHDSLQQELTLDGVVDNIRHFAFKDTEELFEVELNIGSPRIVWNDLKNVMSYSGGSSPIEQNGKAIKESLSKVLQDFNPNVKLSVDVIEYSDQLSFNNIFAHAYLENNLLKIDSANVSYGDSHIQTSIDLDISHHEILPFDLALKLTNIDIAHTLKHFDYFDVEQLRSAKQIEGNFWFDLNLSSVIDLNNNGFLTPKTYADIKVDLQDVIIEDLETINTVAKKIKRLDRFNELKFAPIESRIKVEGTRITVEETEIQSNAIQAFVEGTIDKNSAENLWISIPVKNVKTPNLDSIPERSGYAGTGKKIFFSWVSSNTEKDGKVKLHMTKKNFYKERPDGVKFKDFIKGVKRERRRIKKTLKQKQ